jgi:HTH-type transcriptional regulator/antitoxin HipB
MVIRSIGDLAAHVRGRRKELGMSQDELAHRAGVSRKWIYDFEAGKPTAQLGILLRVLDELGLALDVVRTSEDSRSAGRGAVDLDALLDEHRRR